MTHNPLSRDFAIKLNRLNSFSHLVEDTLVGEVQKLNDRLATEAATLDADRAHDLYEYHADDHVELSDELPTVLRYSVLTTADTALETYLNDTCQTFAEVEKAKVRLSDFTGRGIRRAKEYLKKVAGVRFPDSSPTWDTILKLHQLRNSIVHADAFVPAARKDLHEWSDALVGYRIDTYGRISLDREFTGAALTVYEKFASEFDELCEPLVLWRSVFPVEDV